jgi:phage shock protein PspC (stress-responsive transcriptional regulator)
MKTYQQNENQYYTDGRAKLTRDADNRRIAGVCSGLGKYFGLDTSLIRLAWFFLAFFGIFSAGISTFMVIMAYFILWFVVPKNRTIQRF